MAGETLTTTSYIQHHLTNMTYGKLPAGYERLDSEGKVYETLSQDSWVLAHNPQEMADMGFMAIHLDSMGWSIALGLIFSLLQQLRKLTQVFLAASRTLLKWLSILSIPT